MVVVDIKISTIITLDLPCFKVNGKKAIYHLGNGVFKSCFP